MKKAVILMWIILGFILESSFSAYAGELHRISEQKPKIISVIFDDSTSMVRDDPNIPDEKKNYTTRWVEADYALKAMAAMMDEGDELRLYKMGDFTDEEAVDEEAENYLTETVNANASNILSKIKEKTSQMSYVDHTYYWGVDRAAKDLGNADPSKIDRWIVIITDGAFDRPEGDYSSEKLKSDFLNIAQEGISIAYIPIGKDAKRIEDDPGNHIITPVSGSDDDEPNIILEITDIINRIYGRVRIEDENGYYLPESDNVTVNLDIPVEKVIVLLQYAGVEQDYSAWNPSSQISIRGNARTETIPSYLTKEKEITFEGKTEKPISRIRGKITPEYVQYKELKGEILSWRGNSALYSQQKDSISIPINQNIKTQLTSEVYYQPAIDVNAKYLQNGEEIEHSRECQENGDNSHETESCIEAGELTVKLELVDRQNNKLLNENSPLLYSDEFTVTITSKDEGSEEISLAKQGNYQYSGSVPEGSYLLEVLTPWNEKWSQNLEIQEERKELTVENFNNPSEIVIDDPDNEKNVIAVAVKENGQIPEETSLDKISVFCETDSELVKAELLSGENGIYKFQAKLVDPKYDGDIEDVEFQIKVSRAYANGKPETAGMEISLPITSGPHTLELEWDEDTAIEARELILFDKEIPLTYICDGEILDTEQKSRLNVKTLNDSQTGISMKEGNLNIESSIQWLFKDDNSVTADVVAFYPKLNGRTPDVQETIVIPVKPVPFAVRMLLMAIIFLMILWAAACLIKLKTSLHIPNMECYLKSAGGRKIYPLKLKRIGNLFNPFCSKAVMEREIENKSNAILPEMELIFRHNPDGTGWVLCNYENFLDKERYTIGGKAISEHNYIFSPEKKFAVIDKHDCIQELYMEDK